MRMSTIFGTTLRDAPGGADVAGHQLLLRAGFVRQTGAGIFSFLPLGVRAIRRLEAIVREEMERAGAVEVSLPVVLPAELWKQSGRFDSVGPELVRLKDRRDRDLVLAMTHEEVVATLAATEIQSWRQLPRLVYQIQTKFRDDPRPRAGLVRTREFVMKDAYSLDRDEEGLAIQYQAMYDAYVEIFRRCGLPSRAVEADVGMMGGSLAHEFMYPTPIGEDTIVLCESCGYAKNRQVARAAHSPAAGADANEALQPLERVATPGTTTIDALVDLLGIERDRTAKVVFLAATIAGQDSETLVVAVVRGDKTLNETKLANAVGASDLRPMTLDEIRSIGCVPGFASPIGIGGKATVVIDEMVVVSPNLVAGANEEGFHFRGVNAGRDYTADMTTDITAVEEGDLCAVCGAPLRTERAVEVGNIFRLGTKFAEAAGAHFLDQSGNEQPVVMGSYGIGIGRLLGCLAEEHRDDRGLVWPVAVAPFAVHIVPIGPGEPVAVAGDAYDSLTASGLDVLLDDREERPGVKFADADLIGVPLRLTVSERSLAAGGLEAKARTASDTTIVPLDGLAAWVRSSLDLVGLS